MFDYNEFKKEVDMKFARDVVASKNITEYDIVTLLYERDSKLQEVKEKYYDLFVEKNKKVSKLEEKEIDGAISTLNRLIEQK